MTQRNNHALIGFLESREDWLFGYGRDAMTHDCARFCGAGVAAVTGRNPLKQFASQWSTAKGALRVLRRHGGMRPAVESVMKPVDVSMAQRGDVGMVEGEALVLIEGDTVVGLAPACGYLRQPRAALICAWTV